MTDLLEKILKQQERINHKLNELLNKGPKPPKQTWVKVSDVMEITGWDRKKMYQARQMGWITWRKTEEKGFEYLLQSVHEHLALLKKD